MLVIGAYAPEHLDGYVARNENPVTPASIEQVAVLVVVCDGVFLNAN